MMDTIAFWPSFLKMVFALTVVLGLLVGAMCFFKRFLQQTSARSQGHGAINIVTSRCLGPKSSIMLVDVLGKLIVVGVTATQMSYLATISDAEALEKLKYPERQESISAPLADCIKNYKIYQSLSEYVGRGIGRT